MGRPVTDAKQTLLREVIAHVQRHGLGDVSLRALAEQIGTSHRMLLFHFGSRDALMAEVVRAVEAEQRATVAALTSDDTRPLQERMAEHWQALLDPTVRNNIVLFFEVFADALRGRAYAADFLGEVMDAWLPPVTEALRPVSGDDAPADARLMLAVVRGLLLDAVTTGDTAAVDRAMQRFAAMFTAWTSAITVTPRE